MSTSASFVAVKTQNTGVTCLKTTSCETVSRNTLETLSQHRSFLGHICIIPPLPGVDIFVVLLQVFIHIVVIRKVIWFPWQHVHVDMFHRLSRIRPVLYRNSHRRHRVNILDRLGNRLHGQKQVGHFCRSQLSEVFDDADRTDENVPGKDRLSVHKRDGECRSVKRGRTFHGVGSELVRGPRVDGNRGVVQHVAVDVVSLVAEDRHLAARVMQQLEIDFGHADVDGVVTSRDNCSPWIDHQCVAIRTPLRVMLTDLQYLSHHLYK